MKSPFGIAIIAILSVAVILSAVLVIVGVRRGTEPREQDSGESASGWEGDWGSGWYTYEEGDYAEGSGYEKEMSDEGQEQTYEEEYGETERKVQKNPEDSNGNNVPNTGYEDLLRDYGAAFTSADVEAYRRTMPDEVFEVLWGPGEGRITESLNEYESEGKTEWGEDYKREYKAYAIVRVGDDYLDEFARSYSQWFGLQADGVTEAYLMEVKEYESGSKKERERTSDYMLYYHYLDNWYLGTLNDGIKSISAYGKYMSELEGPGVEKLYDLNEY